MLACVCNFLALFIDAFRQLADLIRCIADIVFLTISGCATSQVVHELKHRGVYEIKAPEGQLIDRTADKEGDKDSNVGYQTFGWMSS